MGSKLDAICPYCDFHYRDLRTGYTYQNIYEMFWVYDDDPSTWRYKRRHTILGKWHQLKMEMWQEHVDACSGEAKIKREYVEPTMDEVLLALKGERGKDQTVPF